MKDNDLSTETPRRFWVTHDVVLTHDDVATTSRKMLRRVLHTDRVWTANLLAMNVLWRWSGNVGLRLELAFIGLSEKDHERLWKLLDLSSANCFSDHLEFDSVDALADHLNYRPDVVGVIDTPSRFMAFGSRGTTIQALT